MTLLKHSNSNRLATTLAISLLMVGCSSSSDDDAPVETPIETPPAPTAPAMASFEVSVSNLTNAQPLSPVAVIVHDDTYSAFEIGASATVGFEVMAEGGDNADLIAEAEALDGVISTASGTAPIGPAASETITFEISVDDLTDSRVSLATMLVNTNDAFTGLNGFEIGSFEVDQSTTIRSIAYESGTEANTETAATIPGPAGGGEGFNAVRDDAIDQITAHMGVISQDDGLATSDLTEQHRFDNTVVQVTITRTE